MKHIKLFEQFVDPFDSFDSFDPFGEEVSSNKNQWYDFDGWFYVLEEKLPLDNYIRFVMDGNHECIEYDYNIKQISITHSGEDVMIQIHGDLVIENKNYYEDEYIINSLKAYIEYQMKKLTQYDGLELEDFQLYIEKK